eukprot:s1266_g20.t1
MTLMTGSPVSAWGCRSPMLEMVKPQWRTPCNSRASSRPSSAPRIRPGSAPVGRRLGPPLWRPELALPESPKRPRSAPLRRSASAAAPAAAPAQPPAVPGRPASAGQMRPKKVQQRRSVPTATISNPESAGLDEKRAVFSSPEKAEKALASAAAEIQALCDSCRAALVVKTQCGSQLVTANFDDKERRRRATRGLKVELKAPKRKPPKPFPENIFKESAEHLPSLVATLISVLSTLREGNEGLDEMERFANRVKDVDEKLKVLEEQAADLKSEPELDDLQEIKPMGPVVIRRKDSVSMMRRWSRSISPDDSGNPFLAELGRQGSRRTAHVANFQNSLGDPPRRSDSHRSRGPSKDSDLSSTRSKSSARKVVMNELDGLLDHLTKDPAEEGFSAAEVTRLRAGFKRFMMPGTIDVHKDDVFELLTFLGCVFLDPVKVRDLMDKTTRFDHLGFDDFEAFMGKYTRYCQSQYQVIFDQFDADESGTISMEELREMTHHLGFMPTRLMLEEAVEVACRSRRAAALSFNELVQFLMIYRRREGFCREEVDKLRGIHNHHSEGNPPVMPVSQLSTALIQAFGRQVTRFASELQDQLASGQILRSSQVSPDPDFEPEKLSFSEFLIMSRNCREVLHRKLDCMWPRNDEKSEGCFAAKAAIPQQGLAIKCNPGGEGTITDEELRLVLRGLGYMPLTKAMLDIYNDVIGSPIPRDLDYDEFFDFVWRFRSNCGFSSDELEDLQELYRISDEDNSGEICALELASMFRSLGYRATMEDLSGLVLEVDHDQSGFLSFSEFVTLMGDFRALELKKIYRVFDDLAVGGYLQAENITKACKRVGAHLIDQKHMPDEDFSCPGKPRRALRRHRAKARRAWYLHKKKIICLSPKRLRQVFLTLREHHSRDDQFLYLLAAEMAKVENIPWRCLGCKQLRRHNAQMCPVCQKPWQQMIDHTYVHGGRNAKGSHQQSTPYYGGWQQPQWANSNTTWQEQHAPNQTPKKSPRRGRSKSARGGKGGDTPRGKGPQQMAQPAMMPMVPPMMMPYQQFAPPLPPPETPWTPAAAVGPSTTMMPVSPMMPHPVMMPTMPPGAPTSSTTSTATVPTSAKHAEPDYKGFYIKAKQRQSELPSDMQQDIQKLSVKDGAKCTKDLYAAVRTLDQARKNYDEAVLARAQSHANWKQFLGDAIQLWKSYAEQFAVQEKSLQDQVNATRANWQEAKEDLDNAKVAAGEIQEIKSDEEQEVVNNDTPGTSSPATKISDSMAGLATQLANLHQEAEQWVDQDRQAAKRPRREQVEAGDAPMEAGAHFGAAG